MASEDEQWQQQIYPRLLKLVESSQRGMLKPLLFKMPQWQRTLYFQGNDIEVKAALDGLLTQGVAGAGAGTAAADDIDHTADIVTGILRDMGQLDKPPLNANEFGALLKDRAQLKVPVVASLWRRLQSELPGDELRLLQALPGQSVTVKFSFLLMDEPYDLGRENRTTAAMQLLLSTVLHLLGRHSDTDAVPHVRGNHSERGAGSIGSVVGANMRPDCVVVCGSCTVMIGADQEAGKLHEALRDIQSYARAGLPAVPYGKVGGIPAYAAAGTELQFLFIRRDGTVLPAGPVLNLSTSSGRLAALCAVIQLYRVIVAIANALPWFADHVPLWYADRCDEAFHTGVTLTPRGAIKTVRRFEALKEKHGVTEEAIRAAYKAAAVARNKQLAVGQKPFLVSASKGPVFSGRGLEVHTQPLGYQRSIDTEEDARHLVRSCLRAVHVLHAAGVVHTDLRLANTVWLDEKHCMVIDLEHCRPANKPLPENVPNLISWGGGLVLEERDDGRYYTPASDLYQIGQLLKQFQEEQPQLQSGPANDLVRLLVGRKSAADPAKPLTAQEALQHAWLREEGQHSGSRDAEGDEGGSGEGVRSGKRKRKRAAAASGDVPKGGKRRKGGEAGQGKGAGGKGPSRRGAKG